MLWKLRRTTSTVTSTITPSVPGTAIVAGTVGKTSSTPCTGSNGEIDDTPRAARERRAFASGYAPILALYAIGNGFLALAAFPYYLQYAKGDLRLHLWGNIVFVLVLMPAIVLATSRFGAIGAGAVWASTNLLFFFCWTPIVHRRFLPGLHRSWLVNDVLKVLALPIAATPFFWLMRELVLERTGWGSLIVAVILGTSGLALWQSRSLRPQLLLLVVQLTSPLRRKVPAP